MIVLDASAAIDLLLDRAGADAIGRRLSQNRPVLVPAHFEADAYAGLRRMANAGMVDRNAVAGALVDLADLVQDRAALAPLLTGAYRLFDQVGAHDAFYVVLARHYEIPLLTSDGHLARAAAALGVAVHYHPSRA